MPIYEYQCQTCHRTLEKRQKFSDPELTVCPHCEGKLEKLISAPSFQFAGGGWYADGYGNKSAAKPGGSSEGSTSGSTTASSDSAASSTASAPAAPASTPAPSAPSSTSSTTK